MAANTKQVIRDRIGSLTIALGWGAAIACGGTGQAWATEDSSPSVSASSNASASTSGTSAEDRRHPKKHRDEPPGQATPGTDATASPTDTDAQEPRQPASRDDATEQDQVHPGSSEEATIDTTQVTEPAARRRHSDRLPNNLDDTHRQLTRPIRPAGVVDDHTDSSNAVTESKRLQPGEQLGSETAALRSASIDTVEVTSPLADNPARTSRPAMQPVSANAQLVSTAVSALFDPAATADVTPQTPFASPTVWTLLAFARREFDRTVSSFTPTTTAAPAITTSQVSNTVQSKLVVDTADAATTQEAVLDENLYTGQPSFLHDVVAFAMKVLNTILTPFGGVVAADALRIPFITDGVPFPLLLHGLDVTHTEFEGMPVMTFTPPEQTDKVVVAIHGGAYIGKATIFHWWTYTDIARQTGATVVVPDYTLSPTGTAETEVPRMADFISQMISEHGAENVSVLGDSSGGGLALLSTQELVRRHSTTPGHLVLLAPWLDVSMSDPRSAQIDDPLLNVASLAKYGKLWAGDLATDDPLVSPLFGSLDGLPPTAVYSSSRDMITVDTLRLRDRVRAEGIPNFTFRLAKGEMHDWVIYAPLPDAQAQRANLYSDLDL